MVTCKRVTLLALLLAASTEAQAPLPKLLLMTKLAEGSFRHDSIPVAVDVIPRLASGSIALPDTVVDPSIANAAPKFDVVQSEDDGPWEDPAFLSQFAAVAFVLTGDGPAPNATSYLSEKAGDNLGRYLEAGGGLVGIVSCSKKFCEKFF